MTLSTWKDLMGKEPNWCPGCGDFGVLRAIQMAAVNLELDPSDTALVTGIGCSGNITAYIRTFGFHGIHGRALPAATGIKLANPDLTVLVAGGDGDGFGIGLGHFLHAARRNIDVTYIVMDNQVYGLTKGQTSPTTDPDMATKASPLGPQAEPVNPLELALSGGATFVAQGFSANMKHLVALLEAAVAHKGFSIVNVQSPCVTYNKLNTIGWFKQRIVDVADAGHDAADLEAAHRLVRDRSQVPIGIIFQSQRETLDGRYRVERAPSGLAGRVAAAAEPAAAMKDSEQLFDAWMGAFQVR